MTYYEMLEISESASDEVVRMAYKALAKKYHPDVYNGDPTIAEEKMKQLNEAFAVLSNQEKRAEYDALLREQNSKKTESNNTSVPHNDRQPTKKRKMHPAFAIVATVVLIIVVGFAVFSLFGGTQDIEAVKDSVVMVEVYNDNGDLIATGSGFCAFKKDFIVTNFHVVEGASDIKIITDSHKEIGIKNIAFFNKEQDLAVISINGSLTPLKLGNGKNIKTKDKITTIGSPKGVLNTVSEGIISNVDDKDQIRITAPISHGSSGGVLLNRRNEVIGITSAGYDDAQNLNFAINISILEKLYAKYQANETTSITAFTLSNHIGSLSDFDGYLESVNNCFTVGSMDVFHKLTDNQARFEALLEDRDYSWYAIYDDLSRSEKDDVVALFIELNDYEFNDNNVDRDIGGWDSTDFFICLGVLSRYEYAITLVDVDNYTDKDSVFTNVDDNYPLEAAEKSLILYLLCDYDWSEIHVDNKEDIFDYFDAKYGTEDLGAILEMLGYEVVYENDGTLTAYW